MLDELIREAQQALIHFSFIRFLTDMDVTDHALKLRLVIDSGMFIQAPHTTQHSSLRTTVRPLFISFPCSSSPVPFAIAQ